MDGVKRFVEYAWKDLRWAIRMLYKNLQISLTAILVFALGIGLSATMFSIVRGALGPLPFKDAERLIHIEISRPQMGIASQPVSIHDYQDWRAQQRSFEDLAAFRLGTANVRGEASRPERYPAAWITANTFETLGTAPALGRSFEDAETSPGAAPVVILGHALWLQRFQGSRAALGQSLVVNGTQHTIIGVMPEGFEFPVHQELWLPLQVDPLAYDRGRGPALEVFGKLKEKTALAAARRDFATINERLATTYPEANEGMRARMKPYHLEFIGEEAPAMLNTMLGAVLGVLLIACLNIASLLLARSALRSQEMAIRSAVGAQRRRLIQQILVEVFVFAALGASLGLALAALAIRAFNNVALSMTDPPYWIQVGIDLPVVLFVLALAVAASLISGVVPAIRAASADVNEVLKDESRGTSSRRLGWTTSTLVVVEIAVSCALLVGAGLMIKSIATLTQLDYGFATEDVLTARFELFAADYPTENDQLRFFEDLERELAGLSGVRDVTLSSVLPGAEGAPAWLFAQQGQSYVKPGDHPITRRIDVGPGFFEALDVEILEGRGLEASDRREAVPVTVVNRAFAERYYPGQEVIGKQIRLGTGKSASQPWRTIVGVVPDLYPAGMASRRSVPALYTTFEQRFPSGGEESIAVRILARSAAGDPLALTGDVRQTVHRLDPDLPIFAVETLAGAIEEGVWHFEVLGALFMVFGLVALLLAGTGLHAVIANAAAQRSFEMGVRIAFGAQSKDVLRLVFTQILKQLLAGVLLGLLLAVFLAQGLGALLFEIDPFDPAIFTGMLVVILATALVAAIGPAMRMMRTDPVRALRYE